MKAKKLSKELEELKAKLIEMETRIRQLMFEKGKLSKKNHDLEGRVNVLEGGSKDMKRSNRTRNSGLLQSHVSSSLFPVLFLSIIHPFGTTFPLGDNITTCTWSSVFKDFFQ